MSRSRTLDDLPADLTGKRVLVRVDLNVPMQDGSVSDDTRLRAAVPTIAELADKGAVVLLLVIAGCGPGRKTEPENSFRLTSPVFRHGSPLPRVKNFRVPPLLPG